MNKRLLATLLSILAYTAIIHGQTPGIKRSSAPNPNATAPKAEVAKEEKTDTAIAPKLVDMQFDGTNNPTLKFVDAPATILLETYANATQKTLLIAPNLPKAEKINLRSHEGVLLTKEEYLQAIEAVLVMHNIALVPAGDKFLRVLPANELRKQGVTTHFDEPEGGAHTENGKMVSQIIQLKNITYDEAKKAIEGMKRNEGQIQIFERTNSILITDTVENVNRMIEILKYIDIPIENREETHVRPIKFAKAADIKTRLEEIIKEALAEQQKQSKTTATVEARPYGSPQMQRRQPGIRPRFDRDGQPQAPAAETATATTTANAIHETLVSDAERGVIRGKVQIIADERTNLLIFITRPENMKFFDKIIDVLDVQVQTVPDVIVNVFRLEYATAKDVADMLNNLIGNTQKSDTKDKDNPNLQGRGANQDNGRPGESASLSDFASRQRQAQTQTSTKTTGDKNKIGELSKDNVTILADERSNAVIVMASPTDMLSVESIIKQMDIQLSQVVIETIILSVSFGDSLETGMDWIQRAMVGYTGQNDGTASFAFATAGGGGSGKPTQTEGMTTIDKFSNGGGVNAWLTFFNFNLDLVLKAVQTDNRARIVSSPRITTMDNEEATLESTERIYWSEGTTHYNDSDYTSDNVKSENVGIKLTVTPRIYKKGFITLKVNQSIDNNNGYEDVAGLGKKYPKISSRSMEAAVSVQSGETVVLGGLSHNEVSTVKTKVPILGSIPLLGWFFRSSEEKKNRTEIIVFLTPRIIDTPADIEDDARKIKSSVDTEGVWDAGWSQSRLADPLTEERAKEIRENAEKTIVPPRTNRLDGISLNYNETTTILTNTPAITE